MQNLIFLLTTSLVFSYATRTFRRRFISNTGCSLKMPGETFRLDKTFSDTGEAVYMGDQAKGKATYGFILAKLNDKSADIKDAEHLLYDFLEGLLQPLSIEYTTGLSTGHRNKYCKNATGMIDYWQDDLGSDWKVKGWTNGSYMAVLYVKNFTEENILEVDEFLNGFRFRKPA